MKKLGASTYKKNGGKKKSGVHSKNASKNNKPKKKYRGQGR